MVSVVDAHDVRRIAMSVCDEAEKHALPLSEPRCSYYLDLRLVAAGDGPAGGHRHHPAARGIENIAALNICVEPEPALPNCSCSP